MGWCCAVSVMAKGMVWCGWVGGGMQGIRALVVRCDVTFFCCEGDRGHVKGDGMEADD